MRIAQRIRQFQASEAIGCSPSQVLADGRPPPKLSGGQPVLIPYADNMNVFGTDRARAQVTKDKIVDRLFMRFTGGQMGSFFVTALPCGPAQTLEP